MPLYGEGFQFAPQISRQTQFTWVLDNKSENEKLVLVDYNNRDSYMFKEDIIKMKERVLH